VTGPAAQDFVLALGRGSVLGHRRKSQGAQAADGGSPHAAGIKIIT